MHKLRGLEETLPITAPHAVVQRFGPLLGKRFTRDNLPLLGRAATAVRELKRSASTIEGRDVNIFTQWVGDPDALGSAVLLKAVLEKLGAKRVRILTGMLGHPQNRTLVEKCDITLSKPNEERFVRGLHCMVDASPPLGKANTGAVDSVKDFFFVADHHRLRADVERECADNGVRSVTMAHVGLPVGSTSAFMAVIAAAFDLLEPLGPKGRAAAALGIYTDTSALLHGATPLDFRMFERLTRDTPTRELLDDLRAYRVTPDWFAYRATGFSRVESRGRVRIAATGYVREDHRDVIAEIASDLIRVQGTSIGIAVAVTDRGTEVSVRADSRLLGHQPERIVRVVEHLLEYTFPGCSGFKFERRPPHRVEGGACVPHSDSQQVMWKLGKAETGPDQAKVLEHCRACSHAMMAALEDLHFAKPDEIDGLI